MQSHNLHQNKAVQSTLYVVVFHSTFVQYFVGILLLFFLLQPATLTLANEAENQEVAEVPVVLIEIQDDPVEVMEVESEVLPEDEMEIVPEENNAPDQEEDILDDLEEVDDEVQEVDAEDSEIDQHQHQNEQMIGEQSQEEVENGDQAASSSLEALSIAFIESDEADDSATTTVHTDSATSSHTSTSNSSEKDKATSTDSVNLDTNTPDTTDNATSSLGSGNKEDNDNSSHDENSSNDLDAADEEIDIEPITKTDEVVETSTDLVETPLATTTEESNVTVVSTVTNNLNAHQFADTECISVGDGAFYCSESDNAPEYIEDAVFSAPDSDGDMEIFVTLNGETTQITHNIIDDSSPYYDGLSDTIVWHSSINDRFQIMQYDLSDGSVTQITSTSYNNMEPVAYGNAVLWQAWIGSNWEIVFYDGQEVTQLTENDVHDIAPQMRDGYIMWQTQFAEGWKIALFDLETQKIDYIADGDGTEIANPRFVLVYDSTDNIGDVQTLGYDFGSGDSFHLGSLPTELPEKIPEPDQTGETRALLQSKPTTKENESETIDPITPDPQDDTPVTTSTTSKSIVLDESDIVVTASTSEPAAENIVDTLVEEVLNEKSEEVSHIDDVVIPPFAATTTEEIG